MAYWWAVSNFAAFIVYTMTRYICFQVVQATQKTEDVFVKGINSAEAEQALGGKITELRDELELLEAASNAFDLELYRSGVLTPVFFGSAISNLGVDELMANFAKHAPPPQGREAETRKVESSEEVFTGFVFKDSSQHGSFSSRPHCVFKSDLGSIRKR